MKEENDLTTLLSMFILIHRLCLILILQSIEAANKDGDQYSHKVTCNCKFALFAITTKISP